MICNNCGEEITEEKKVCETCGSAVNPEPAIESSMAEAEHEIEKLMVEIAPKKESANNKLPYIVGMVVSLCAIIISFVLIFGTFTTETNSGSSASTTSTEYAYYGGDAYTGIQQAAADASNNAAAAAKSVSSAKNVMVDATDNLQNCISTSVGILCLIISGLGFCYFFVGFSKEK